MKSRSRSLLLIVMLAASLPMLAAPPSDFYVNLLNRGIADLSMGRNDVALRELRIAAFGMVDNLDQFQVAHIYGAIAADRLGLEQDARRATQRVVAAERMQKHYATLELPASVRTDFESVARKSLTDKQLLDLRLGPMANAPKPAPAPALPSQTSAASADPVVPQPRATAPAPTRTITPPVPAPTPARPVVDVAAKVTAADRALAQNDLPRARTGYREVLTVPNVDHATMLRVVEGLYRSRDFAGALQAFTRAGELRRGEEPYRFYRAVALYETGDYAGAKRELANALPYIEMTQDVARYKAKIDAAR